MNQITTITMNNTIDTGAIIGHIQNMEYENRVLKEELSKLKGNVVDAERFYAVSINVEMVSKLHNVHPDTVRKYVSVGLIEKHPNSTDAKILIRASVALLLDFSELKRRYMYRHRRKTNL